MYAEIINVLKEIYQNDEISDLIESTEASFSGTSDRQLRRSQELKKFLLVDYIKAIFSKNVCDVILLKNKKGEYTIKLKSLSSSIHKITSYEVASEPDNNICTNPVKTELYFMIILDGIQANKKYLAEVLKGSPDVKSYIDNILCNLENWKNDKTALISSFPYWADLQEEVKKKYIVSDIRFLYSSAKDKGLYKPMSIDLIDGNEVLLKKQNKRDLEIEFPMKNEGKERIGIMYSEKAVSIDTIEETSEVQQLISKNLKSTEITLDDNTSIYYIRDNDEHYTRTYYFLMDKENSEEKHITGLTLIDINTLSALLKLAADDLITNREIAYNFRDIACTVHGKSRLSINEYNAVYNSLVKLSSFFGKVKSNNSYATKVYDLIKCNFYYPKSTEEQGDIDYEVDHIKTFDTLRKEDTYAMLHVNVRFSSEYVERLKHAVFLDKKLSDKISNNRLAKAISVLLQTERYEWYKQCLEGKIKKEDPVSLSHKDFFCRQLYLPLSGRKMYRDRDNILEAMKMIADMDLIIHGEVSFDSKSWSYCFHYVDISEDEASDIQDTVSNLRNKVLIPFLPIEEG